jgi:hypothetical protein
VETGEGGSVSELRIFHVATDFIVARTQEEAEKYYIELVGEYDVSVEEMDTEEVPREKWNTMKIVDPDTEGHPEQSFREAFDDMLTWDNQEYPKILASSEY